MVVGRISCHYFLETLPFCSLKASSGAARAVAAMKSKANAKPSARFMYNSCVCWELWKKDRVACRRGPFHATKAGVHACAKKEDCQRQDAKQESPPIRTADAAPGSALRAFRGPYQVRQVAMESLICMVLGMDIKFSPS